MKTPFRGAGGRRVPGSGPLEAPLVVCGEAPGADEELQGAPFVGSSGSFLRFGRGGDGQWPGIEEAVDGGVRYENVVEQRPLDNEFRHLTPEAVARWQVDFHRRVAGLERPVVLAPVGNVALNTLLRLPLPIRKKGGWRTKRVEGRLVIDWPAKIGAWRGSVWRYRDDNRRAVKVMPTFHPAYVLRNGNVWEVWREDLEKIVADCGFPELNREPRVDADTMPTLDGLSVFTSTVEGANPDRDVLVVDIETAGPIVLCIGMALVEDWRTAPAERVQVIVPPTTPDGWGGGLDRAARCWQLVRRCLRSPVAKAFHYGVFDTYVLKRGYQIPVTNWRWDTQQMSHALNPRDRHTLAYAASRHLRIKFWKDEGKEESGNSKAMTRDQYKLRAYCAKDVAYTAGILSKLYIKLKEEKLLQNYLRNYRDVTEPCVALAVHGFRVDEGKRKEIVAREKALLATLADALDANWGCALRAWWAKERGGQPARIKKIRLVAKTGLSNAYVATLVYDMLGCKWRGREPRSTKELRLRQLCRRYPKLRPLAELVFQFQQHKKIAEFAAEANVDRDGRMRSLWTPTTKTGRLRSRKNALGSGRNQQNNPRDSDLRAIFVAEPGQVLVEVDQSQAEDRLVGGMSGDRYLMELAQSSPVDVDVHQLNADRIFHARETTLSAKEQRTLGKRTKHAVNYDEGPQMMADSALLETEGKLVLDPDECAEWLAVLRKELPGIDRYQAWVRQQMLDTRQLHSAWGAVYKFTGLRISQQDYKEGYAYLAQEGVGRLMNRWGFVPLAKEITDRKWRSRIVQQGHDSLVVSCPPAEAWQVATFLDGSLSRPKTYPGAGGEWTLKMPLGYKVGCSWKEMVEWKTLPEREEFETEVSRALDVGRGGGDSTLA